MDSDLAGRVASPFRFLSRLLAWDRETWGGLWFTPRLRGGTTPPPPPRPVGMDPPPPHRSGARQSPQGLREELLDIYHQVSHEMKRTHSIHWVLTPDAYNTIRKLKYADGDHMMTHRELADPILLGWPVKVSCEAQEPWSLRGRFQGEMSIEEPNPLMEDVRLG